MRGWTSNSNNAGREGTGGGVLVVRQMRRNLRLPSPRRDRVDRERAQRDSRRMTGLILEYLDPSPASEACV